MTMQPKVQILVLQSTGFCNINCSYCYLPGRNIKKAMSAEVLSAVSDQIIASDYWADDSLVLWHAGEPTALGTDWYETAYNILEQSDSQNIRSQFQTNGILVDDKWLDFFDHRNCMIGLSIDGPRQLHDLYRVDRRGRPTFDNVIRAARQFKSRGLPFSTISVVTEKSLSRVGEIFDFFTELRPERVAFSIEEAEGSNAQSSLYNDTLTHRVEEFFYQLAMRNFASSEPLRIREIESVLTAVAAPVGRTSRSQEVELGWIVTIGMSGDLAFFSPELLTTIDSSGNSMAVGNILDTDFNALIDAETTKTLQNQIQLGVESCASTCSYYHYCGGGSPANKHFETGRFDVTETRYCQLAKKATVRGVLRAISDSKVAA